MAAILLVEDDSDTRGVVHKSLEAAGYTCLGYDSGEAALAEFAAGTFDAAVVDVHLPGIDGVELVSKTKEPV